MTKSRLVLVLRLIGYEDGASFLDQSQSVVKQNQCNPDYFRHSIENCSNVHEHVLVLGALLCIIHYNILANLSLRIVKIK